MGCSSSSDSSDSQHTSKKNMTLGVDQTQTDVHKLKVVEGLFVTTKTENPYDYYEELGEGSYGKVHKVIDRSTKAIRAMKTIDISKTHADENHLELINEIELVKNLDHSHIFKVFEIFSYQKKIYIVMEYFSGGELFEYVSKNGRLKENEVSKIMKQIISAINFYQSYGIIHSDIKPENILIESKEDLQKGKINVKLIDFGLSSKISANSKSKSEHLGTISYMAPETFENDFSLKSDIWSAGVVMFYMLEGKLPFKGNTNNEVIQNIKTAEFNLMVDVSFESKDFLNKVLNKNKNQRFSPKEALEHRFITKYAKQQSRSSLTSNKVNEILKKLKSFQVDKKLQEIVLGFIVHHISEHPKIKEMKEIFNEYDIDGDGRLTTEELTKCLGSIFTTDRADEISQIVAHLDSDQSGFIECQEFVRATIDQNVLLTDENLIYVYNIFDKDRSGKITADEIAETISKDLKVDSKICKEMLSEVDLNGDGELSLSEFKKMMKSIFI